MTIWKYNLLTTDQQTIEMPKGAEILCVQVQFNSPRLWVLVNPDAPKEPRNFEVYGTGHRVSIPVGKYVGSYQLAGGSLIFHVFEDI